MIIRNVKDYKLKDDASIGEGNINTIAVENSMITVKCSVPVVLTIAISELDIELEMSEKVVKTKSEFAFGFA